MARVALVTGGVSGIGAATVKRLMAAGYKVAANFYGNDADAQAFAAETGVPVFAWDISDFDACRAGVEQVEAAVGPIDILVNNAGITADCTLHKMTLQQWRRVIDVDLNGCFNMCRHVIEGMRARKFGRIVNVSSVNALSGQFGQTNYSAAKAGIIGFSKALALESARIGITVNVVAPGYTETAMVGAMRADVLQRVVEGIPVGRLGQPDEIARTIQFLVGEEASFITGATFSVNGGKYMA